MLPVSGEMYEAASGRSVIKADVLDAAEIRMLEEGKTGPTQYWWSVYVSCLWVRAGECMYVAMPHTEALPILVRIKPSILADASQRNNVKAHLSGSLHSNTSITKVEPVYSNYLVSETPDGHHHHN